MQAMILAAGFGTRLLPYTKLRPKPLFPVLNRPLLVSTIENLLKAGCERIVVNCHHLREQILEAVKPYHQVILQEEVEILGTGGGLRGALEHFSAAPLLITNGDIFHNIDLPELYSSHSANQAKVTLAVHDYERFNSLRVDEGRLVDFEGKNVVNSLAFTGIHVIDPEILFSLPENKQSCIIERYRELLRNGDRIALHRVDHCFWTDMGTKDDYLKLHQLLLQDEVIPWKEMQVNKSGSEYVSQGAVIGSDFNIKGWACIGDAIIGDNVTIERSVVWDGARIASGTHIYDEIITPNYRS